MLDPSRLRIDLLVLHLMRPHGLAAAWGRAGGRLSVISDPGLPCRLNLGSEDMGASVYTQYTYTYLWL